MRRRHLILFVLVSLFMVSCGGHRYKVRPDPTNPIRTVAVLPMYNATNDGRGPEFVRKHFIKALEKMHYTVMPANEVDGILRDRMGITLGSQFEFVDTRLVGETLGVDGVIYGYLLNFDDQTAVLYNSREVRAAFKLVDTVSNDVVWGRGRGVTVVITSKDAKDLAVSLAKERQKKREGSGEFDVIKGLKGIEGLNDRKVIPAVLWKTEHAVMAAIGGQIIGKALGIHLMYETDLVVDSIIKTMPVGPGN